MDVAAMIAELNDHGFTHLSTTRKLAAINATLQDVGTREHWPILHRYIDLAFDGAEMFPTNMPADFRAVVVAMYWKSRPGIIAHIRTDDAWLRSQMRNQFAEFGIPRYYWYSGQWFPNQLPPKLLFYPIPAVSTSDVNMVYVAYPPVVAAAGAESTIWLPPAFHESVVVQGAVYRLYLFENDMEISREFERLYESGIDKARVDLWTKSFANDYIHAVNEDDWTYDE